MFLNLFPAEETMSPQLYSYFIVLKISWNYTATCPNSLQDTFVPWSLKRKYKLVSNCSLLNDLYPGFKPKVRGNFGASPDKLSDIHLVTGCSHWLVVEEPGHDVGALESLTLTFHFDPLFISVWLQLINEQLPRRRAPDEELPVVTSPCTHVPLWQSLELQIALV